MDPRRSLRFKTHFDVLYSAGPEEGAGVLSEVSYAGARLENTSLRPALGARVKLYVFVQPVMPFELEGHVARITDSGFAIQYELFDPEIRRLVDDLCALVAAPPAA